jgi:hypothetical protein
MQAGKPPNMQAAGGRITAGGRTITWGGRKLPCGM